MGAEQQLKEKRTLTDREIQERILRTLNRIQKSASNTAMVLSWMLAFILIGMFLAFMGGIMSL